jgi:hypothetical protein
MVGASRAVRLEQEMTKHTLIFPAGMPGSLAYLEQCQVIGASVVGASSLHYDPNGARYPAWTYLPLLTDPGFDAALDRVIADLEIAEIFTPHPIIRDHLRKRAEAGRLAATLQDQPVSWSDAQPYRQAMTQSRLAPLPVHFSGEKPPLSETETAALLYHAEKIPGMCDRDKTLALMQIFRRMPEGDVVEIGSWWGKSAFVMHRLSQLHSVGPLLCIDPWASENFVQNDDSGLVDRLVADIDADEAHRIFAINLLPYAKGDANYLRMPAQQALARLAESPDISSPEFGSTLYSREIAALHIDGNHAYENAKADIIGWTPLVKDGGWIIIDDYVWPWGDGPQRAGDEFLAEHGSRVDCAFVMGTALFIQLQEAIPA